MENRALGKGLSALIPEKTFDKPESVNYVKINQVKENTFQPRQDFNNERLSDLIASVKEKGVLQPILVRKNGEHFEVIAGERRLRAARALGLEQVPVIIKSVNDQEALILALVENIQREELNAVEEAHAFRKLIEDFSFTQDSVAQSVGKDRATIANILRLLKLPEEIQKSISDGILTMGHARALLSIDNARLQKQVFERTVKKGLSVRAVEDLARREATKSGKKTKTQKDIYAVALEEELQKVLGTKVRIEQNQKGGRLIIEYYSLSDLDRITEIIKK